MNTADFDYELPEERIAQTPAEPRDSSRLLVLNRASGQRTHTHFAEIGAFLRPHDLLVANHSRVLPARLFGCKLPGGGAVEVLLVEQIEPQRWKALVGGKGLRPGRQIELGQGLIAQVLEEGERSERVLQFNRPLDEALDALGQMPLPPYIHAELQDKERYQTVYSRQTGSVAAPTAGLHFTPELLSSLQAQGVGFAEVLLHVGLDTFAPVHEDDPAEHHIHTEWCSLPAATAAVTQAARAAGGRTVAVGTTSVRTLESAARSTGSVQPYEGRTDIYILPGYRFNAVDAMITNFHLPRSTLLMLVSAFAGRELILDTYREAIALNYRFYSFGDAMLIV
ncbi:MAG TPA: tRNA preQ1(34) S-adenosylmethionine ribosyltransferase-isomerase QueA [Anaerolineales bacterium]|nr:tRNA preQ1(34) S-adenosylmethionine ribosyltransferase-isomerase QueA [Anaerolineales bacterium]HRQ91934.1 tRNA preQ1(34) S-adenosylmethionine ribosyltransferase-isomerase QueA [Anaerolineales bacterium]